MNPASKSIRQGVKEISSFFLSEQPGSCLLPAFTYVPPTHARALDPEAILVEGVQGAGKSFWFERLASSRQLTFLRTNFPEVMLPAQIEVAQGFGFGVSVALAPNADTLTLLLKRFRPRSIWHAVIARHARMDGVFANLQSWEDRVTWVEANPERFAVALEEADFRYAQRGQTLLIVFDALDSMADEWVHIRTLAKGLLQVALDMRSTRSIRCKVFVQPDLLEDSAVTSFPDFSKLFATKSSLLWLRADLYALLFQCLGNVVSCRTEFLEKVSVVTGECLQAHQAHEWVVPKVLRQNEFLQAKLFELIAGTAMGSDSKRGKPYTWLVKHLQAGWKEVNPRCFFAALGTAADETADEYSLPLDSRGIRRGVRAALNTAEDSPSFV